MISNKLQDILLDLLSTNWIKTILSNDTKIYLVGGSVRDSFINKPMKDIDLVVDGLSMNKIQEILKPFGFIKITGESFAVIKFRPKGHIGEDFDIAIPREDKKIAKGHKGFEIVTDGVDIFGDLKRRDFTINSIAVNIKTMKLIDPYNGIEDIKNKIIKATDSTSFVDDPLRILRGIQFASRFNFSIDSQTMELMKNNVQLIEDEKIPGERIFDEFKKIIEKNGNTAKALLLINETNLDQVLFKKKMDILEYDEFTKHIKSLDAVSFYYILGLFADVDIDIFLKNRLKADENLINDIKALNNIIISCIRLDNSEISIEELKFILLKIFTKSIQLMHSKLLPLRADEILKEMNANIIPTVEQDIQLTGKDVIEMGNIKEGPKIGIIKTQYIKDALMNRFKWSDRDASLIYLWNLLYEDNI